MHSSMPNTCQNTKPLYIKAFNINHYFTMFQKGTINRTILIHRIKTAIFFQNIPLT